MGNLYGYGAPTVTSLSPSGGSSKRVNVGHHYRNRVRQWLHRFVEPADAATNMTVVSIHFDHRQVTGQE